MKNFWTCPKCGRIFEKKKQVHSCRRYPIEKHFKGKEDVAKPLFNDLKAKIRKRIGPIKVISLPCCIHFFGLFDFAAIFPLKGKIRVHFMLNYKLKNPRIDKTYKISSSRYKYSIYIESKNEIDKELLKWLKDAYHYRDKQ